MSPTILIGAGFLLIIIVAVAYSTAREGGTDIDTVQSYSPIEPLTDESEDEDTVLSDEEAAVLIKSLDRFEKE